MRFNLWLSGLECVRKANTFLSSSSSLLYSSIVVKRPQYLQMIFCLSLNNCLSIFYILFSMIFPRFRTTTTTANLWFWTLIFRRWTIQFEDKIPMYDTPSLSMKNSSARMWQNIKVMNKVWKICHLSNWEIASHPVTTWKIQINFPREMVGNGREIEKKEKMWR